MKRHLTLHIGLSKTGSSSIQRVLAGQRPALQEAGIYYPRSPGWANHALLPASLVSDPAILWGFHPGTWEGMSQAGRLDRFRREWDAEMAALPDWASGCIISAEQIGGLLRTDEEVQRLADLLAHRFATIRVIVYLRRQDRHLASAYSQWLRGGILQEPRLPETGPEAHFEYDYGPMLEMYARAFGEAAIYPRIFSRASLAGGDVVADFMLTACFCIPIPPAAPQKNANAGIAQDAQALMLLAGRRMQDAAGDDLWRDQPVWRRFAESVSERFPGRGWQPTQGEAREFLTRFAATNEQVRARFFPDQDSLFDMDFSDLPAERHEDGPETLLRTALDLAMHEMARSARREAETALAQFRLLRRLDDRQAMRACLGRAVKYAPDNLEARLGLADWFLEEGDLAAVAEHLQAASRIAPADVRVLNKGRRLARMREKAPGAGAANEAAPRSQARQTPQ